MSLGAIFRRLCWGVGVGVGDLSSIHSLLSVGDSWEKPCIFGPLHGLIYEVREFAGCAAAKRAAFFTFVPDYLFSAASTVLNWVTQTVDPISSPNKAAADFVLAS